MFFVGLCAAITMSSGAVVPSSRLLRALERESDLPPLHLDTDSTVTSVTALLGCAPVRRGLGADAATLMPSVNDAGLSVVKVRARGPIMTEEASVFLDRPDVRTGVDSILRAIDQMLPGYVASLDVVNDPDETDEYAFLMVSVHMRAGDQVAWDLVERVIDEQWLNLPPRTRSLLGVGRELVSVD